MLGMRVHVSRRCVVIPSSENSPYLCSRVPIRREPSRRSVEKTVSGTRRRHGDLPNRQASGRALISFRLQLRCGLSHPPSFFLRCGWGSGECGPLRLLGLVRFPRTCHSSRRGRRGNDLWFNGCKGIVPHRRAVCRQLHCMWAEFVLAVGNKSWFVRAQETCGCCTTAADAENCQYWQDDPDDHRPFRGAISSPFTH